MTKKEFAVKCLLAIQQKNEDYFIANQLTILDCVRIVGERFLTVQVMDARLPFEIKKDIEILLLA